MSMEKRLSHLGEPEWRSARKLEALTITDEFGDEVNVGPNITEYAGPNVRGVVTRVAVNTLGKQAIDAGQVRARVWHEIVGNDGKKRSVIGATGSVQEGKIGWTMNPIEPGMMPPADQEVLRREMSEKLRNAFSQLTESTVAQWGTAANIKAMVAAIKAREKASNSRASTPSRSGDNGGEAPETP